VNWSNGPEPRSRLLALPEEELEKILYPVGFYRNQDQNACAPYRTVILGYYNGRRARLHRGVIEDKGVGRKTANLVISEGYQKPGVCVDTHRTQNIPTDWAFWRREDPHKTEEALRRILPGKVLDHLQHVLGPSFGKKGL